MQVYLFSGSFLFVYSALKARFLPDECDAIEPRVSSQSFRNKRCMHLCQVGAYKDRQINVDGLLPKKSPERLTVTFPALCIPFAMKRTGYSATLEKIVVCVCMSCGSLTRISNFESDMPPVCLASPCNYMMPCPVIVITKLAGCPLAMTNNHSEPQQARIKSMIYLSTLHECAHCTRMPHFIWSRNNCPTGKLPRASR